MKTILAMLLAAGLAPAAFGAYKCVDAKGVTHVGDTPPDACANVVMYETRSNGSVARTIEPTPTPEQVKTKQEEAERRKEADRAAAEQKRKDLALLNTYSSEHEIDVTRDRNLEPLSGRIANNRERIKQIDKHIVELEDEMEFYKAGKSKTAKTREPPFVLVQQLKRAREERESLDKSIASTEREMEAMKARFESDKKRWHDLKTDPSMRNQPPAPAQAAVAGTMIPGAAGMAKCGDKVYECQAGQTYQCRLGTGRIYKVDCVVERK
jgi:hypothetical protein